MQMCTYVLNGALLQEHNVAYYLERCSESVGLIDMDHCLCNAPLKAVADMVYSLRVRWDFGPAARVNGSPTFGPRAV